MQWLCYATTRLDPAVFKRKGLLLPLMYDMFDMMNADAGKMLLHYGLIGSQSSLDPCATQIFHTEFLCAFTMGNCVCECRGKSNR